MQRTRTAKVEFPGAGGETLAARLDRPLGDARAVCLFAHCFTCSKDIAAAARIARALAERGFAVLRFDFTGLGHSGGEFANTNFSSNVADLVAAADWLRREELPPAVLIGHSLGGAAVLAAAERIPESVAVATIGAPADPAHVRHLLEESLDEIEASGSATVTLAGRQFRIRKQFLDDLQQQTQRDRIARLRKALLVLHAPHDRIVGIDNAAEIFQAAKHPKSFVSLDTADHLLTQAPDAVYAAEVLAAWASRFIPDAAPATEADRGPAGQVLVRSAGTGRYAQEVRMGAHTLRADEPASVGGEDSGPTPYALLLAALGTCTSMTLQMYAARKGWSLEDVAIRLEHDRIHAEDCADCEQETGRVDRIRRAITMEGDLSDEQRRRLLEIADRCPVHRTLVAQPLIETKLLDREA
jgi:putative redox protein